MNAKMGKGEEKMREKGRSCLGSDLANPCCVQPRGRGKDKRTWDLSSGEKRKEKTLVRKRRKDVKEKVCPKAVGLMSDQG